MRGLWGTTCGLALALAASGAALAQETSAVDEVIVTGTRVTGLRASDEVIDEGLDLGAHGERAYHIN